MYARTNLRVQKNKPKLDHFTMIKIGHPCVLNLDHPPATSQCERTGFD